MFVKSERGGKVDPLGPKVIRLIHLVIPVLNCALNPPYVSNERDALQAVSPQQHVRRFDHLQMSFWLRCSAGFCGRDSYFVPCFSQGRLYLFIYLYFFILIIFSFLLHCASLGSRFLNLYI